MLVFLAEIASELTFPYSGSYNLCTPSLPMLPDLQIRSYVVDVPILNGTTDTMISMFSVQFSLMFFISCTETLL